MADKNNNNLKLKNLFCREMLIETWHTLNQDSSVALSYVEVLLDEKGPGFTNETQKKMLLGLYECQQRIRATTLDLRTWLQESKDQTANNESK